MSCFLCTSAVAVWIDADPSVGIGEVDDGLALIQALNSKDLAIRGVSVVFGNAGMTSCFDVALQLVTTFSRQLTAIPIYRGAPVALDLSESNATAAIAAALEIEPLVIIALGPLTNIAALAHTHPESVRNISRLITVAGRRQKQIFRVGNMKGSFPDLNFEKDVHSLISVMQTLGLYGIDVVLMPWAISSKVWLQESDLRMVAEAICGDVESSRQRCSTLKWVLDKSIQWAKLWAQNFGTIGFNPFDTLAVGFVIDSSAYYCDFVKINFTNIPSGDGASVSVQVEVVDDISIHLSAHSDIGHAGVDATFPIPNTPQFIVQTTPKSKILYCHSLRSGDEFIDKLRGSLIDSSRDGIQYNGF